jgi:RNA polymerase sigma factor (sigma-70 family)
VTGDDETDADLAVRAARGDDAAFARLMARHKAPLFSLVRRYVGEPESAVEVVQDAFLAAWRNLRRYDPRRPFGVWLRAIALNKCRDLARRQAVRRLIFADKSADSPEAEARPDTAPDAEAVLAERQRHQALDRAIAQLPAKLKEALVLTHFDDLSQQAAADVLGVTPKTVETRVYRARQKLAEILGGSTI